MAAYFAQNCGVGYATYVANCYARQKRSPVANLPDAAGCDAALRGLMMVGDENAMAGRPSQQSPPLGACHRPHRSRE